ncbi:SIR2 family protein [Spirosoma aerophilum]
MQPKALLVGNDINNILPNNSWKDLLTEIIKFCQAQKLVTNVENKPFPLLYEEIFLKSLRNTHRPERDLKSLIAKKVSDIEANQIHQRIRDFATNDIMTTNYEFTLESQLPGRNSALIDEKIYSIFRHYKLGSRRYWHIHGDCRIPNSICLGFEHYGGQLQQIRNYVVTGTAYANEKVTKLPLIKRLETNEQIGLSWIDLFFTADVYILGLSLDFVETDLWWLLTYRARQLFYRKKTTITNEIYYFIPKEYRDSAKEKIDLLQANGVTVIDTLSGSDKVRYYNHVLDRVEQSSR